MSLEHGGVGLAAGAVEHDRTGAQADDAVGVRRGQVEEVQVDDRRDPQLAVDPLQVAHHHVARRRVERCNRFVGEDDLRLLGERPGDADALALPTREVGRPNVGLLDDLDALQRLHGDLDVVGGIQAEQRAPRRDPVQPAHQHVVQHRRAVDEVERLEDHPDVGTQVAHLTSGQPGDVDAVDLEVPRRQRHEAVDRPHERRLARSGEPDDDDELAVGDLQVDVLQGVHPAAVGDAALLESGSSSPRGLP